MQVSSDDGTNGADFETATTGGDQMELRLWLRMLTCTNLIETEVRQQLRRQFGITLARFDLLAQLARAPKGLTMGQLSKRLMVSNGNVTGLISRLEGEGLVERQVAPHDKRAQIVRLTERGDQAFSNMLPAHSAWIRQLFGNLDPDDVLRLMNLLAKLKSNLPGRESDA